MPYNQFDLASDMEAYGKLIEQNARDRKQASGIARKAELKLAVMVDLLEAPPEVNYIEGWAMQTDGKWAKKALPIVSKSMKETS